jgi:hypothetical protein
MSAWAFGSYLPFIQSLVLKNKRKEGAFLSQPAAYQERCTARKQRSEWGIMTLKRLSSEHGPPIPSKELSGFFE